MKFHTHERDAKIAEKDEVLDCGHTVIKNDKFYVLYDYEQPVLVVCRVCVIIDKKEDDYSPDW
jgi:hypothetical protein